MLTIESLIRHLNSGISNRQNLLHFSKLVGVAGDED
jgi:hypothetical protein